MTGNTLYTNERTTTTWLTATVSVFGFSQGLRLERTSPTPRKNYLLLLFHWGPIARVEVYYWPCHWAYRWLVGVCNSCKPTTTISQCYRTPFIISSANQVISMTILFGFWNAELTVLLPPTSASHKSTEVNS